MNSIFTAWLLKPQIQLSMLESLIGLLEIGLAIFVVLLISSFLNIKRKK